MSEKKPIKRNVHIVKLSKDHHFTLLFCWKIRCGLKFRVEPSRIISYVNYFWQHHMQSHFREEETILFAPVKDAAVQKALKEHAQITEQIQALNADKSNATNKVAMLADTVDNHVRYEERELFPHLESVLTDEQLNTIGKQLDAQHDPALKDDFADEFWLKNNNGL
ncbi:hemerythrin domain-containing protein [Ilyomonas limi]|uniref:Hemerythrin domain-containing protein n=1 Tax=Ilyomonas limi TaxID=2575867 RepID=A0A4U3LAF0_9BACT|nr:hemerythrin domain-containing protein [Ilyomonas limi]TKK71006.1 hemerythrin domain-containing protein [Ilyomonas limi]